MSRDPKNYVNFVLDKISELELELTIKSLCYSDTKKFVFSWCTLVWEIHPPKLK